MAQGAGIAERQGLVMQGPGLFDLTDIERENNLRPAKRAPQARALWDVRLIALLEIYPLIFLNSVSVI